MTETARITADWLSWTATRAVVAALDAEAVRFVGGAVRDSLLGRPVSDVDLATPLSPDEVVRRLRAAGLKAVPTGIDHGTVTAVAERMPFEVTTLRRDVETYGRLAKVAFTDDWRADAARRDFTMNALYADPDGRVHDYVGGVADARAGRVRFIGDPARRIEEDALRILRFFRFHAHYGAGAPDAAGLAACRDLRDRLDILSIERVQGELLRLLAAPDPRLVLRVMQATGILAHVLPGSESLAPFENLVAVEQSLGESDALRRLAALISQDAESAGRVARRLKLSNAQRRRLVAMTGAPPGSVMPAALRAAAWRDGAEAVRDRLVLAADPTGDLSALRDALAALSGWTPPRFPVTGGDLKAMGITEGRDLGALLRKLEDAWVESDFTLTREALLGRVEEERA